MAQLLTVQEAATRLRLSRKTLYHWASLQPARIPHIRLGSRIRFDAEHLEAWIVANGVPAGTAKQGR